MDCDSSMKIINISTNTLSDLACDITASYKLRSNILSYTKKQGYSTMRTRSTDYDSRAQNPELYYTHTRANNDQFPLLTVGNNPIPQIRPLYRMAPLGPLIKPLVLSIRSSAPKNPVFADYHACTFPVFSDRLKRALEPLVFSTVEFLPATLTFKNEHRPYWLLHAIAEHDVMDPTHSEVVREDTGTISWIDKLVLDHNRLTQINRDHRQLFRLKSTVNTFLWHEDIVKVMTDIQATGIQFSIANGYSQDDMFK